MLNDCAMKADALPTDAGIYAIVNRGNGDRYVGQATNIRSRVGEHLRDLRAGRHFAGLNQRLLQDAWNRFAEDAFDGIVLEIVRENKREYPYAERPDNLSLAEQFYIDEKSEYNPDKHICAARHRRCIDALAWRDPPTPVPPPSFDEVRSMIERMALEDRKALIAWLREASTIKPS